MSPLFVLIFHKSSVILTLTGRCLTVDGHVASAQVNRSPSTRHSNTKFLFFHLARFSYFSFAFLKVLEKLGTALIATGERLH